MNTILTSKLGVERIIAGIRTSAPDKCNTEAILEKSQWFKPAVPDSAKTSSEVNWHQRYTSYDYTFCLRVREVILPRFKNKSNEYGSLQWYQVCKLQSYSLLHPADNVVDWGPARSYAQWLPEGQLKTIKDEADCPSNMVTSVIYGINDDDQYKLTTMKFER